ncbi:MAG: sulfotransferase domain-containing protein [Pseudomonadota bacterium]
MTDTAILWPQKTRELHNHHFDSTIWNDFAFRDDDIVIATYAKSGTTWMQQIISQLIFEGAEGLPVAEMSPWLDLRIPPKEEKLAIVEAQDHRRFLKTHLPVDALVFSPRAKYVYIGRDGRDVVWSFYNHHAKANGLWYELLNDSPGRVGPPIKPPSDDVVTYFQDWLARNGHPFWPFWENIRTWWAIRDLPNVLLVHFADLKADLPGEIRRIADFLEIPVTDNTWPSIIDHCGFEYMKTNAAASVPLGGAFWDGGAGTFLNKGTNGRWHDRLSPEDIAAYETRAAAELSPACRLWLAGGRSG